MIPVQQSIFESEIENNFSRKNVSTFSMSALNFMLVSDVMRDDRRKSSSVA